MTSTIHTLARYQAVQVSGGDLGAPLEVLLEDLVTFLTAGTSAPARPAMHSGAAKGGRASGRAKPG